MILEIQRRLLLCQLKLLWISEDQGAGVYGLRLIGLKKFLEEQLQSLVEIMTCPNEWFTVRLLSSIVPKEFVGVWECCRLSCGAAHIYIEETEKTS